LPGSPDVSDRTWFGIARSRDGQIGIEGALEPWAGDHDHAQLLLVDDLGPIQWLLVSPDQFNEEHIADSLERGRHGKERPLPSPIPRGDLTIAICTRERPDSLRSCLERMGQAVDNRYDVLVIDNAPRSDATAEVVRAAASQGMRIRSVVEPRPGLSRARNRALQESATAYVAFTDDDARPERGWPEAIHRGFSAGQHVAVVTGLVPPAQIENRVQALFEKKLKWSNNLEPELYSMVDRNSYSWPFPYSAGHFGTGANFAVDRGIALALGGFDEALGAGTRTEGGEDMEMFVRVLRADYELAFQPSAIVWHIHRSDEAALRKVLFGYGKGLSATAVSEFLRPGKLDMIKGQLQGARNLMRDRQGEIEYGMPWEHLALELAGLVYGPIAYWAERKHWSRSS
jgi:GT2 family glycosyltransferase